MKFTQWTGLLSAVILGAACFLPWTFHPDLNKYFTGFFSEQNKYGRPGTFIIGVAAIAFLLFAINKRWAQRANWVLCSILMAYTIRTYLVFSACYRGICPVKQPALFIVTIAPIIMLVMAIVPQVRSKQ